MKRNTERILTADGGGASVAFIIDKYAPFIGGAERQAQLVAGLLSSRLARTFLRAHPLYLGKGRRRWIQGPIHALGGLVNRGPCIEVIARPQRSRPR